jgi:hypothetical protein
MPKHRESWRLVSRGLQIKRWALWLFLTVPLLAIAVYSYEIPWGVPLTVLGVAAALDVLGRLLCLAAPLRSKASIVGSVVAQLVGLSAVGVGWSVDSVPLRGVTLGALLALFMQVCAAYLFTEFMLQVANRLHDKDAKSETKQLQRNLAFATIAGAGFSTVTSAIAVLVLFVAIFTCGAGFVLAIPGAVVVLPFALLFLVTLGGMYRDYFSSLASIRSTIDEYTRRDFE